MAKTIIYNSSSASTVFDTDNIAVDESTGNRYVNDRNSSTIYRIDSGGTIETLLTGYQWNSLKFIGGYLYASQDNTGISKIDLSGIVLNTYASTGTTVAGDNGRGSNANQLDDNTGVVVDSSNNVYVLDRDNHRLQKWAPGASTGVTVLGGGGSGSASNKLNNPMGMDIDSSNNIYIADKENYRIQKWTPGNSTATTVAGGNGFGSNANQLLEPMGVAIDSSGNLYVADGGNDRVQKFASGSSSSTNATAVAGSNGVGSNANQLNNPHDVAVDSSGNLYVADRDNHRIQKFASGSSSSYWLKSNQG